MYSQKGEIDGIKWYSKYLGGRSFKLMVGSLIKEYECEHEPRFGLDFSDYEKMNKVMDSMHSYIIDNDIKIDNTNIDKEIQEEDTKAYKEKIKLNAIKREKDIEEWIMEKEEKYESMDSTEKVLF